MCFLSRGSKSVSRVGKRIVVILAVRRFIQELPRKQMSKSKAICHVLVLFVFRNQVELGAEVSAGRGWISGHCDSSAAPIYSVVFCSQPEIVKDLSECPFFSNFLID